MKAGLRMTAGIRYVDEIDGIVSDLFLLLVSTILMIAPGVLHSRPTELSFSIQEQAAMSFPWWR